MNNYCYVTHQVNEHCNQEESACPNCHANMFFIDGWVLECEECLFRIDTNPENGECNE
jgi:predicted amidophosphoribosyltransferase